RPAIFDRHILTFNVAGFSKAPAESAHAVRECVLGLVVEEPDHRYGRLLRARHEWPQCRPRHRTADECYEVAPPHSITSSASASRFTGISMPSAFAVLRLMTSEYFVGCCTGRSAGLAPLRMRSM